MPLYEYYCADCQTKFETLRPMSKADEPIQCKQCESVKTSRVLSLFAAHTSQEPGFSTSPGSSSSFGGCGCGGGACGCSH